MSIRRNLQIIGGLASFILGLVVSSVFQDRISNFFNADVLPKARSELSYFGEWFAYSWLSKASVLAFLGFLGFAVLMIFCSLRLQKANKSIVSLRVAFAKLESDYSKLKLFHEVERRRDPLTGIPNSRALTEFFQHEVPALVADRRPITLILLDINGFGELNRDYGKFRCDEFLRQFSRFIASQMRVNEPAFRFSGAVVDESVFRVHTGGDEFIFSVNGTEVDAIYILNRIFEEILHEAPRWGAALGISTFVPKFNSAVYQYVHSCEWLGTLARGADAANEVSVTFRGAQGHGESRIALLKSNYARDLRRIERLVPDDAMSAMEALFKLSESSKLADDRLARGSDFLNEEYKSFVKVSIVLAGQVEDINRSMSKFRAISEKMWES